MRSGFWTPDTGDSCPERAQRAEGPFSLPHNEPSFCLTFALCSLYSSMTTHCSLPLTHSLFFSITCALFCASQFLISFLFNLFRTLCAKHPGGGVPLLCCFLTSLPHYFVSSLCHPSQATPLHGVSHPKEVRVGSGPWPKGQRDCSAWPLVQGIIKAVQICSDPERGGRGKLRNNPRAIREVKFALEIIRENREAPGDPGCERYVSALRDASRRANPP